MARGRKKGGLSINSINDTKELINMITNQVNSLNKKIKAFKNEGIEEHLSFVNALLTDDMVQYTDTGTISKSKKFFEEKNIFWLKKTLSALHKINNNEFYGTVNKYNKEVSESIKNVSGFVENYLREKGYSEQFIAETLASKNFFAQLFNAFNNKDSGYGSGQTVEKVALTYNDNLHGLSEKEVNKTLSNIEHSRNVMNRLKEENEAFKEFKRNNKKR